MAEIAKKKVLEILFKIDVIDLQTLTNENQKEGVDQTGNNLLGHGLANENTFPWYFGYVSGIRVLNDQPNGIDDSLNENQCQDYHC